MKICAILGGQADTNFVDAIYAASVQVGRLHNSLQETTAKLVDSQREVTSVQLSSERAVSNMVSKVTVFPPSQPLRGKAYACSSPLGQEQYHLVLPAWPPTVVTQTAASCNHGVMTSASLPNDGML